MSNKKLERKSGMLLGVCAGIAEHMDLDPTVVRIALLAFTFLGGAGLLLYVIMAIVMPKGY